MSNGKRVQYRIRKKEKRPLTYNDAGPYETVVTEHVVSYDEWYEVLKSEARAKDAGYGRPDVWTVKDD